MQTKGIPAAGTEREFACVFINKHDPLFGSDDTNWGEGDASKGTRDQLLAIRRDREEQFVVVAAVQRELQGIGAAFAIPSRELSSGDLGGQQSGADAAGGA